MKAKIEFEYQVDPFEFNARKARLWIEKTIQQYAKKADAITIIFCSDAFLLDLNKKYLQHDYFTDIISFPFSSDPISGELYVSIDRVQDNARKYKEDETLELLRVIIHGILHFIGFKDKTEADKIAMRDAEDQALKFYKAEFLKEDHYFDQVYDVVRCIPKGRVCNYGTIANYLSLGSARMVGWALNQLKGDVHDIPAHRVVNVKGELSGRLMFGEAGKRMARLLRSEGIPVKDDRVQNLEQYFWDPEGDI